MSIEADCIVLYVFWQEVRCAARGLAKSPGFVFITLISLALGIGINTAMFSVIHTAIERPVSARAPRELVDLSLGTSAGNMPFTIHLVETIAIPALTGIQLYFYLDRRVLGFA